MGGFFRSGTPMRKPLPKVIAVIPIYNEEKTLREILPRIRAATDMMVCVNDGSGDQSLRLLRAFAKSNRNVFLLNLPVNQGMAGALKRGLQFVLFLREEGTVKNEDLVVTIDADGQHKPEYIPAMVRYLADKKADVVLTRRDFSVYPTYKVLGNWFLTKTNSILSGTRYKDVESGLRLLKVKTLEPILRYYTGVGYSCAQEIALVSARFGFKVDNDFKVDIAYYRPGTTFWDGFIVLYWSLVTFVRWRLDLGRETAGDDSFFKKCLGDSLGLWKKGGRRHDKNGI